jgi:hypothetical protein
LRARSSSRIANVIGVDGRRRGNGRIVVEQWGWVRLVEQQFECIVEQQWIQ